MNFKKIFIIGAGYVGLANGLALAKKYKVVFIDNDQKKLNAIENKSSPIDEYDLEKAIVDFSYNISTSNSIHPIEEDSLVIVSLPTNYDEDLDSFDTSILKLTINEILELKKKVTIVIKSTVPIGFTEALRNTYPKANIFFSPEFLRESRSLEDATAPERIIISPAIDQSKAIGETFKSVTINFNKNNILYMGTNEAESVKLFSNTYLAMRVAFINEIDTFCEEKNLDSIDVIKGICLDSRIGEGYNNPSFGYGGYCFPKDTKQAKSAFKNIPESIISAVVKSNEIRAEYIVNKILETNKKTVGFYRLNMKTGSDNIRNSSSLKILEHLLLHEIDIIIYELIDIKLDIPKSDKISFTNDLNSLIKKSEIIVANRISPEIANIDTKIYSRDIFYEN